MQYSRVFKHTANGSKAKVTAFPHYATFGSPMPTRTWSDPNAKYKYGFNGKEKDDDVNVNGGSYDFGARIYDSRLGRWLSLDPLQAKYPNLTPFQFSANGPILIIDPTGMVIEISYTSDKKGKTIISTVTYNQGKFYNAKGKEITGKKLETLNKNTFVAGVASDIESLRNLGGESKERLEVLEKSKFVHTIQKGKNESAEKDKISGDENKGTGTNVYYDQKNTSVTGDIRPGFIALGHELLGHSYQSDQGITQFGLVQATPVDPADTRIGQLAASEIVSVAFENQLRNLYNIKLKLENPERPKDDYLKPRHSHSKLKITEEMFKETVKQENVLIKEKSKKE